MAAKLLIFSELCKTFANYFLLFYIYISSTFPLPYLYLPLHPNRTSHRPYMQLCTLQTDVSPPPCANQEAAAL